MSHLRMKRRNPSHPRMMTPRKHGLKWPKRAKSQDSGSLGRFLFDPFVLRRGLCWTSDSHLTMNVPTDVDPIYSASSLLFLLTPFSLLLCPFFILLS